MTGRCDGSRMHRFYEIDERGRLFDFEGREVLSHVSRDHSIEIGPKTHPEKPDTVRNNRS